MSNDRRRRPRARAAGVTLIELIVTLVIVGAALAGMVAVFASTTRASVDPVVVQQMQAIADNMMEEILLKPYAAGPNPGAGANGARIGFDDVSDYDTYGTMGIQDVEGNAIAGLQRYQVAVTVRATTLTGIPTGQAKQITVTVTNTAAPNSQDPAAKVVLTGWRTDPS